MKKITPLEKIAYLLKTIKEEDVSFLKRSIIKLDKVEYKEVIHLLNVANKTFSAINNNLVFYDDLLAQETNISIIDYTRLRRNYRRKIEANFQLLDRFHGLFLDEWEEFFKILQIRKNWFNYRLIKESE
ncbi:MAG: hypothetical protein ACFE9L_17810 [Candidatus Hodarchaeota archaeon]